MLMLMLSWLCSQMDTAIEEGLTVLGWRLRAIYTIISDLRRNTGPCLVGRFRLIPMFAEEWSRVALLVCERVHARLEQEERDTIAFSRQHERNAHRAAVRVQELQTLLDSV